MLPNWKCQSNWIAAGDIREGRAVAYAGTATEHNLVSEATGATGEVIIGIAPMGRHKEDSAYVDAGKNLAAKQGDEFAVSEQGWIQCESFEALAAGDPLYVHTDGTLRNDDAGTTGLIVGRAMQPAAAGGEFFTARITMSSEALT